MSTDKTTRAFFHMLRNPVPCTCGRIDHRADCAFQMAWDAAKEGGSVGGAQVIAFPRRRS